MAGFCRLKIYWLTNSYKNNYRYGSLPFAPTSTSFPPSLSCHRHSAICWYLGSLARTTSLPFAPTPTSLLPSLSRHRHSAIYWYFILYGVPVPGDVPVRRTHCCTLPCSACRVGGGGAGGGGAPAAPWCRLRRRTGCRRRRPSRSPGRRRRCAVSATAERCCPSSLLNIRKTLEEWTFSTYFSVAEPDPDPYVFVWVS